MKTHKILPFTLGLLLIFFSCKEDKPAFPVPQFGTMTDIEGNVYKTVKIGDQEWMAENLKVEKFNDGSSIPVVELPSTWSNLQLTDPMMCYYDNDKAANKAVYGGLYNWYAINTGKLAPKGWHIPTDDDWQQLMDYLIANGYNFDGSKIENKIAKSLASTTGWFESDIVGSVGQDRLSNNQSGFNGLSVGMRKKEGSFSQPGSEAGWWSSSPSRRISAIYGDFFMLWSIWKGM